MFKDLTVLVYTFNAERTLPHLLDELVTQVEDIYVIDTGSVDDTLLIAEEFGVFAFVFPIWHKGDLLNRGMELVCTPMVLILEGDESVGADFWKHIASLFNESGCDEYAYRLHRVSTVGGEERVVRLVPRYARWIGAVTPVVVGVKEVRDIPVTIQHLETKMEHFRKLEFNKIIRLLYDGHRQKIVYFKQGECDDQR